MTGPMDKSKPTFLRLKEQYQSNRLSPGRCRNRRYCRNSCKLRALGVACNAQKVYVLGRDFFVRQGKLVEDYETITIMICRCSIIFLRTSLCGQGAAKFWLADPAAASRGRSVRR